MSGQLRLWFMIALCSGCMDASSVRCGQIWCPTGSVCAADQTRCVSPAQLSACEGKRDDDSCRMSGVAEALCRDGACTPVVCGDGDVTGTEVCDDGNTTSCDGCSNDCHSDESCGNGTVECAEQCDQGQEQNSDEPNAMCRPDCHIQRCGDGVVDNQSGEDCDGAPSPSTRCTDYGFYEGEIGCSSACRNDTASCRQSCGDGMRNGAEICDSLWSTSQSCLDFGYDVGSLACSALCTPSFARCERQGFQSADLSGVSGFIYGVWGRGPNDVFAFGHDLLLHYDGTAWSPMDTSTLARPRGEANIFVDGWGASGGVVFAVGYAGLLARYDGSAWRDMPSGVETTLTSVWGFAPDDVFVVGSSAVLLHYDGNAWSQQAAPAADRAYYGLWGSSPSDLYAVHEAGIDHFDGTSWSETSAPAGVYVSVWGSGPDDIFAVGAGGMIVHFDGDAWRAMDHALTQELLLSVAGNGPDDVYASGELGVILHYNGARWAIVPTTVKQSLQSIWCVGEDNVFATASLEVLHLSQGGPTFREIDTGSPQPLLGLWMTSADDVTVVGIDGTAIHFDGTAWTPQAVERSDEDLNDVWAADATHKWAVGFELGTMHAFDGSAWKLQDVPTETPLIAIWGRNASDIFAVGDAGVILHFDGETWSLEDSGTNTVLETVWGFEDGTVYAGSASGLLLRRTADSRWRAALDNPLAEVWGVWGTAPDQLVLAADSRTYFLLGETFHELPLRAGTLVDAVSGTSMTDVFGIPLGAAALYHFDGRDWAPLRISTSTPALYSIAMGRERGYIVGLGTTLIEIDRHCANRERNCADRWDNDCDGLANCADPDCSDNRACAGGGACSLNAPLQCGVSFAGTTASGQPSYAIYPCASRAQPGREVIHELVAQETGSVSVTLEHEAADLDLIVLGTAAAGGCDPNGACIVASTTEDEPERVSFDAVAGTTYYIVVDANDRQAFSQYLLTVDCN